MIYPVTPAPEFFSRRSPSHARHLPAVSKFSQIVGNLFLPPVPFTGRLLIGDSKDRHYLTSLPLTPPPQSNPLLSLFPSTTPHVPPFYALTLFEWVRPRSRHSLLLRVYLLGAGSPVHPEPLPHFPQYQHQPSSAVSPRLHRDVGARRFPPSRRCRSTSGRSRS